MKLILILIHNKINHKKNNILIKQAILLTKILMNKILSKTIKIDHTLNYNN